MLEQIEESIDGPFTPGPDRALRFFCLDLVKIKIVVLGQDPYPQPGAATGRAFEVGGLTDWSRSFRQSSLKNIVRNIHASYTGRGPATFAEIRGELDAGVFLLPPPDKIFDHWQRQGVLCLNTAFTCAAGSPGSHAALWKPFSDRLIRYIADKNKSAVWFLWGVAARAYEGFLGGAAVYKCNHPMLPGSGANGFLNCACFKETKDIVDWI